ncbi:ubiquitin-domain-containing protein [Fomitopsis serialis]|uniref:ubiquitin-domain-containing protein n=1 Tax=Fomitopsis serialis TaxID=139415 RepID=UPI002008C085|nr:ubiquitin-domain-containing protein [Neoantrodia serialis]KAH9915848.1 ubiquitin-domain-containing protein [Neoantrodia serialis]
MSEQAELAFVKTFVNNLSSQPVTYADDFQQPSERSLRKVPVLPVDLPPPPERKVTQVAPTGELPCPTPAAVISTSPRTGSLSITFKSIKPPKSYSLSVQPTDPVSDIKAQLASEPGAPPADAQRLLLKGKALADSKLLQEYSIKEGDTVTLMVKPGFDWDPSKMSTSLAPVTAPTPQKARAGSITLLPEQPSRTRGGHGRTPSIVLSPSPSLSPSPGEVLIDIPLVLDTSNIPELSQSGASNTPYHTTVAQPAFWEHLYAFLKVEFPNGSDAAQAWEDFFCASKGSLSVSEIAKIRDRVGVTGMAGS